MNKPKKPTHGLKHDRDELVIRNVLKQAKTVFEYQQMVKTSEERAKSKERNPYENVA